MAKKKIESKRDNVLAIENLSYSYRNASGEQQVLKRINAEFAAGKMYAIVGESGSGKTTLLSLLSALDKLQEGDIKYNNKSLRKIGAAAFRLKYVNVVFQSYNLIKYMTARENVQVAIDFDSQDSYEKGDPRGKRSNSLRNPNKYLEMVGLSEEEGGRLIGKLSGGQQQRVAIARALASNCPIIVADEPTGNLDEDTEVRIIDLFKELAHEQNKIVVIVTHSRQVASHADEVWKLRKGVLSKKD